MVDYKTYLQDQIDDTLGCDYEVIEKYCNDMIKRTGIDPKGKKILDLGCREFHTYKYFKDNYDLEITGIDVGKAGHEYAHNLGRPSIYCDAHDMSMFKDETFDVIMSTHVFEHMYDLPKAINECKRILKKGGFLYLAVPCPAKNLEKGHWQDINSLDEFAENFKDWQIVDAWYALGGDPRNIKGEAEIQMTLRK